jgi:hypothetical protein
MESQVDGWLYQSRPSITHITETVVVQDDGLWLSCDKCAALIEQGKKVALEERSIKTYRQVYPQDDLNPLTAHFIHTLHTHFWEGRRSDAGQGK